MILSVSKVQRIMTLEAIDFFVLRPFRSLDLHMFVHQLLEVGIAIEWSESLSGERHILVSLSKF